MQMTFKVPASKHEFFHKHAFDRDIGKFVDTNDFGKAKIIKVEVIEDGKAALITIEPAKNIKTGGRGIYLKKE